MLEKMKLIGANIRALRNAHNYTQKELASLLGLKDHVMISYYENGERKIPLTHLHKLADLFNVELSVLFSEDMNEQIIHKAFSFRKDELSGNDLEIIAEFNKLIKSYLKIVRIEKNHADKA